MADVHMHAFYDMIQNVQNGLWKEKEETLLVHRGGEAREKNEYM